MSSDYNLSLPNKILFNLKEIEDLGVIKVDMAKKLVYNGYLEVVKIGKKIHISREELIRYAYAVNVYSNSQRDENGELMDDNIIDGGLCTGSARDAIEFML